MKWNTWGCHSFKRLLWYATLGFGGLPCCWFFNGAEPFSASFTTAWNSIGPPDGTLVILRGCKPLILILSLISVAIRSGIVNDIPNFRGRVLLMKNPIPSFEAFAGFSVRPSFCLIDRFLTLNCFAIARAWPLFVFECLPLVLAMLGWKIWTAKV